MALSFRKFIEGLRIVPKSPLTTSGLEKGDLQVSNDPLNNDGKLHYYNGTSQSPVVTETHSATLTNKTLTSPVLNTPTADTITGIAGGALTVQSASNQNLLLQSQGTGNVSIQSTSTDGVRIEDVSIIANKIKGTTSGTLLIEPYDNGLGDYANVVIEIPSSGTLSGGNLQIANRAPYGGMLPGGPYSDRVINVSDAAVGLIGPQINLIADDFVYINNASVGYLEGPPGGTFQIKSYGNEDLSLESQGTGDVIISSSGSVGVTIEDIVVNSNTVTGGASALTIQSASNQNLTLQSGTNGNVTLQSQGTGNVSILSSGSTGVTIEDIIVNANTITGGASTLSIAAASSQNLSLAAVSGSIILANKTALTRLSDTANSPATTITAPTTSMVDLTGTISNLNTIPAGVDGQILILTNRTSATITVADNSGASVNSILTGTGANISFSDNASIILLYNSSEQRWMIVGGSGGGGNKQIKSISSSQTIGAFDEIVLVNAGSGAITATLPAPVSGKQFTIKKSDSSFNAVTIATTSGSIDDQTDYVLEYQYESITLVSDGTNFFIV